jgi:flagellar biosynthesis/type III secretory pathway protein FliH
MKGGHNRMITEKQERDKISKNKDLHREKAIVLQNSVDLNPQYTQMSWEIVGLEPKRPTFSNMKLKTEVTSEKKISESQTFVQGISIFTDIKGATVLFNANSEKTHEKNTTEEDSVDLDLSAEKEACFIKLTKEEFNSLIAEAEKKGEEKGKLESQQEFDRTSSATLRWNEIIADMSEQFISARSQLEHDMVGMCLDICAHFLRVIAPNNEEILVKVIHHVLTIIDKNTQCEILVSEVDFGLIEQSTPLKELLISHKITVGIESTIRSGCIVKTQFETLNFDIQAAFERAALEFQGE